MTKNLIDSGYSKIVGQDHLKLSIINKDSSSNMDAIAFGMGSYYDEIKNKEKFSICYTIDENVWNGKTSLQLMVKDIKLEN
jgi:single-stranded-DNA-specific exonuclease